MKSALYLGLYESLVTSRLEEQLADTRREQHVGSSPLARAEAADRIAQHLAEIIERAIEALPEKTRAQRGIDVARGLVQELAALVEDDEVMADEPISAGSVLRSILGLQPDGSPASLDLPLIPLRDTTLLTNAPGEPRVGRQIRAEISSADRIDVLMAFVRTSGLAPLKESLARHCAERRELRVLTTTYTGSTEQKALDQLLELGAEVRVSYDTSSTRLHAKAWLFHRRSGFSTAYIGSSNLTHSAQVSGLEWNVRVAGSRNRDVIDKVVAVFETYWASDDFRPYDADEFAEQTRESKRKGPTVYLSPVEIRPLPFQERLLDQLAISRRAGHHKNLLAAATGTGKTVMAALDYARLRRDLPSKRLLFVAHRKEILDQSQATFRHALRDASFGEQWVAGLRPERFDHVFASVQTLQNVDLSNLAPDHFDMVIVDEFHHAAASSYERLLEHVQPRELLGLTATPERSDGLPVLQWFGDRIAAELRLWDAIDQHYLSPFQYFGIHDGLDLREIPWRRGRGYDVEGLTNLYTSSDAWARRVIKEVGDRAENLGTMRALGFCVSVDHARYLARMFEDAGIRSAAIWGESAAAERAAALRDLAGGDLRVIFSVDVFNEGVDVPAVDTLLLLRPTDSPTLFLQQLGRGLRRTPEKSVCTVLDFVGHHRREFRFDRRFRALLGGTRKDVERQVEAGFPFLPAGCHMELDPVAADVVLRSIRESVPSRWSGKVEELRAFVATGREASLGDYLDESGLEMEDVYSGGRCWSDLCNAAGVATRQSGPQERALRRAIGRLLHVDDEVRLEAFVRLLEKSEPPRTESMNERDRRLARMLVSQVAGQAIDKSVSLDEGLDLLWSHPQVRSELREVVEVLRHGLDHLPITLADRAEVPLQVHARYSRLEILAAFGVGDGARVAAWQTGVRWVPEARADLLAFTLDKTEGAFSPTTRYRDYAVSRELIHWESQSVTRADSPTGKRYVEHVQLGSDVFLFCRMRQSDRAFWFLGPATYVEHTGERPMALVWKLHYRLPGDLFAAFAAAAV